MVPVRSRSMLHTSVVEAGSSGGIELRCRCGWSKGLGRSASIADMHVAMTAHAVDVLGPTVAVYELLYAFDNPS